MLLTKPQIVEALEKLVSDRSGVMENVGGDCYALCVEGEIRAAVGVKELVKQAKNLWIGLPIPIMTLVTGDRVLRGFATPHPYRGIIAASHVRYKTLLMIPIVPVAQEVSYKATANRVAVRNDFDVKMTGYKKYAIQGEQFKGDLPIEHLDTFKPIEMLLDWSRAQFEDGSN